MLQKMMQHSTEKWEAKKKKKTQNTMWKTLTRPRKTLNMRGK